MKKILLIAVLFIISLGSLQAQTMTEELKKLRKQKYLESVSIDEATADKYFEVYDANYESIAALMKQKKDNLEYIEKNSDAADITVKLEEMLDIDSKILEKKKELYSQLKTFLAPKQLGQSVVFQAKFNKELKNQIDKIDKKKKRKRDR